MENDTLNPNLYVESTPFFVFCAMGFASNVGETFISSLHRILPFFVVSFSLRSLYIVLLDLAPPFALIFSGAAAAAAGRVSPPPPKGPAAWWMWLVS